MLGPVGSVEGAVLDGFGDVFGFDLRGVFDVGDGAGDFPITMPGLSATRCQIAAGIAGTSPGLSQLTCSGHLPVRESHTGWPLLSRNRSVSVPFTSSRARITSDASCLTFEPVTAISSPLLKLMPISS